MPKTTKRRPTIKTTTTKQWKTPTAATTKTIAVKKLKVKTRVKPRPGTMIQAMMTTTKTMTTRKATTATKASNKQKASKWNPTQSTFALVTMRFKESDRPEGVEHKQHVYNVMANILRTAHAEDEDFGLASFERNENKRHRPIFLPSVIENINTENLSMAYFKGPMSKFKSKHEFGVRFAHTLSMDYLLPTMRENLNMIGVEIKIKPVQAERITQVGQFNFLPRNTMWKELSSRIAEEIGVCPGEIGIEWSQLEEVDYKPPPRGKDWVAWQDLPQEKRDVIQRKKAATVFCAVSNVKKISKLLKQAYGKDVDSFVWGLQCVWVPSPKFLYSPEAVLQILAT